MFILFAGRFAHLNWTDDQIPEASNFSGHIIVVTSIAWNDITVGENRRNRKIFNIPFANEPI